jgi:hypothetical protein
MERVSNLSVKTIVSFDFLTSASSFKQSRQLFHYVRPSKGFTSLFQLLGFTASNGMMAVNDELKRV